MYLSYSDYTDMGGELVESAFLRYERMAALLVEDQTLTRINNFETPPEELKYLMFDLVELNATAKTTERMTSSQSNNGVSVAYADEDREDIKKRERALVVLYLSGVTDDDGVPVLYTGVESMRHFERKAPTELVKPDSDLLG